VSRQIHRRLRTIKTSLKENSPRVKLLLAKSGARLDPAVVFSLTVYYKTLKKLAKE